MAIDGGVEQEAMEISSFEGMQRTHDNAIRDRLHHLSLAGAQLAIVLAGDMNAEPLIERRLEDHPVEAGSDIDVVLTEAERNVLPQAQFIVSSLFKAAKFYIPPVSRHR